MKLNHHPGARVEKNLKSSWVNKGILRKGTLVFGGGNRPNFTEEPSSRVQFVYRLMLIDRGLVTNRDTGTEIFTHLSGSLLVN